MVLWVMPREYEGKAQLPTDAPQMAPAHLALKAVNGNVFVLGGSRMQALALLDGVAPLPALLGPLSRMQEPWK